MLVMAPTQTTTFVSRAIQTGLLILAALMPFHAFMSVWMGHITGHQTYIQAWKEVLLIILSASALALVITSPSARRRLRNPAVICAGAFALLALLVTLATQPSLTAIAFGLKTDLEFLVAFVLATVVATPGFVNRLVTVALVSAVGVITFGLMQVYILPSDFLTLFCYGPGTVPPFLVLDPAVKSLRFASTLGGPNQLGTYLILPLALALTLAVRRRRWWYLIPVIAGLVVIFNTFSRAAWIGVLAAAVAIALILSPRRTRAVAALVITAVGAGATFVLTRLLGRDSNLQYYLLHSSTAWHGLRGSDFEHLNSLHEGYNLTISQPVGHGLGTAGPATFHTGSGLIIENNYLQLSYETGLAGATLFIIALVITAWQLLRQTAHSDLAAATLAALAGVSVTALVLPAWTDSTTALTVWTAAGAVLGAATHPSEPAHV
jgi:hypothetical protein